MNWLLRKLFSGTYLRCKPDDLVTVLSEGLRFALPGSAFAFGERAHVEKYFYRPFGHRRRRSLGVTCDGGFAFSIFSKRKRCEASKGLCSRFVNLRRCQN